MNQKNKYADRESEVIDAQQTIAQVVSQILVSKEARSNRFNGNMVKVDGGGSVLDPCGWWAAAASTESEASPLDVANAIKLNAAKLQMGDMSFVVQSGLGQVAWLSAMSVNFANKANMHGVSYNQQGRYMDISLKAQTAAAKLMLALAALNANAGGDGKVLSVGD